MISLLPSSFFFLLIMVFGVFFSLSSSNWFLIWCGLEMNLMGFIPIIIQFKGLSEIEAAVKYFLIQSLGSAFVLLGTFFVFTDFFWSNFISTPSYLIILGLFIKLGVFPFHFWLPSVMMSMDWFSCLLIVTWQKLAPLFILFNYMFKEIHTFLVMGIISSVVGGLMGMNQVNLKSLIAYSSIGHMGWIVVISSFSVSVSVFYLTLYVLINLMIFYSLISMNMKWMSSLSQVSGSFNFFVTFLCLSFLTISGIPPLLGFYPKLFSLEILISSGIFLGSFILILGTCFSLYYYISLVLNCTLSLSMKKSSFLKEIYMEKNLMIMGLTHLFVLMSFMISL